MKSSKNKVAKSNASYHQRRRIYNFLLYLQSFFPLILSHHPECKRFDGHTLKIGKYGLCIGCFVGYPTAILGLFNIRFFNLGTIFPSSLFLTIGITLLMSYIMSPLNLAKKRSIKIIQKIAIGIGSSFLLWWILNLPINANTKYTLFLIILGSLLSLFSLHHVLSFYKTCKRCDTPFNWAICSGFNSIKSNLEKSHLNNFFKLMDGLPKLRIRESIKNFEEE